MQPNVIASKTRLAPAVSPRGQMQNWAASILAAVRALMSTRRTPSRSSAFRASLSHCHLP